MSCGTGSRHVIRTQGLSDHHDLQAPRHRSPSRPAAPFGMPGFRGTGRQVLPVGARTSGGGRSGPGRGRVPQRLPLRRRAHKEARRHLAEILVDEGKPGEGFGQYLRLAEQYPDDAEIRYALAGLALEGNNWDEAERQGREALKLDPDAPAGRGHLRRPRLSAGHPRRRSRGPRRGRREARAILETDPESLIARRVLIAQMLENGQYEDALDEIDIAVAQAPDNLAYSMLKLQTLGELGDVEPDRRPSRGDVPPLPRHRGRAARADLVVHAAEGLRRRGALPARPGRRGHRRSRRAHVTVVQFLETARGADAAKAELERLIEANAETPDNAALYRSMRAAYTFQEGDRDGGHRRDAAHRRRRRRGYGADPAPEGRPRADAADHRRQGRRARHRRGDPCRRHHQRGGAEDARRDADRRDDPEAAIIDLRRALDQNPLDPEISTLLADAHARNGSPELQGERLATAVQVSNAAPAESLRYAAFLIEDGRRGAAMSVLSDARKAAPGNLDVLMQIGRMSLEDADLGRVRGVVADLRLVRDDPRAAEMADAFEAQLLLRQNRLDESVALLGERLGGDEGDANAVLAIVRTQINAGNLEAARDYIDRARAGAPDDNGLRLVDVAVLQAEDRPEEAEALLREVLADVPGSEIAVRQLYAMLAREGRSAEMAALLDEALEASPGSRIIRLLKAGEREAAGDIEGAIAIYEDLYAENSADVVIANNLASLLTSFSDDPEALAALERGGPTAARHRGARLHGHLWLDRLPRGQCRRGAPLSRGRGRGAARRPDRALPSRHGLRRARPHRRRPAALETAIELARDRALPQMEEARATLARLDAAPGEEDGAGDL